MAIKIEPFSITANDGEVIRLFPETVLNLPEVIQVSGSNWPLTQAIVFAAFGFDQSLVWNLGYKIHEERKIEANKAPLKISYASSLPQAEISLFWDTVKEEITLGDLRLSKGPLFRTIVEMLGLSSLLGRRPDQLSGGETVKVILAAHFIKQPEVLVVDRGLGEIDVHTRLSIINYVRTALNKTLLVALDNSQLNDICIYFDTDHSPITATAPPSTSVRNSHSLFNYTQFEIILNNTERKTSKGYLLIDSFGMQRNGRTLFEEVSIKAPSGSLLWVLGPNGSGKTSFFEALLKLIQPKTGRAFWVEAGSFMDLDKHIAYSPQDPDGDITELTLFEEVALAYGERKNGQVVEWLMEVGVSEEDLRLPLSEDVSLKKLASVLAAIGRSKKVCLLDEPTLFLTDMQRLCVVKSIRRFLSKEGVILCSTHDELLFESFDNEELRQKE